MYICSVKSFINNLKLSIMLVKVGYSLDDKPLHEFVISDGFSFPFDDTVKVFRAIYSSKVKVSFEL